MERYDDLGMMGRGQYGSVYKVLLKAPAGSGIQGETLAMKRLPRLRLTRRRHVRQKYVRKLRLRWRERMPK